MKVYVVRELGVPDHSATEMNDSVCDEPTCFGSLVEVSLGSVLAPGDWFDDDVSASECPECTEYSYMAGILL